MASNLFLGDRAASTALNTIGNLFNSGLLVFYASTQPTDANYSTIAAQVSQTHGSLSAQMMTQQANIRAQIYKVLTPAQQTQLATLQAQMAARWQSREAAAGAQQAPAAQ